MKNTKSQSYNFFVENPLSEIFSLKDWLYQILFVPLPRLSLNLLFDFATLR